MKEVCDFPREDLGLLQTHDLHHLEGTRLAPVHDHLVLLLWLDSKFDFNKSTLGLNVYMLVDQHKVCFGKHFVAHMLRPQSHWFRRCRTFLGLDRFLLLFLHLSLEYIIWLLVFCPQVWRQQLVLRSAVLERGRLQHSGNVSRWREEFVWRVGTLRRYLGLLWRCHLLGLGCPVLMNRLECYGVACQFIKAEPHPIVLMALFPEIVG